MVCCSTDSDAVAAGAVARGVRRRIATTGRWRKSSMAKEKPFCVLEKTRRSSGPLNAVMGKGAYRGGEAESCDDPRASSTSTEHEEGAKTEDLFSEITFALMAARIKGYHALVKVFTHSRWTLFVVFCVTLLWRAAVVTSGPGGNRGGGGSWAISSLSEWLCRRGVPPSSTLGRELSELCDNTKGLYSALWKGYISKEDDLRRR